ncbi:MAG: hypothetical protein HRU25_16215, partial [Psychrobium sp.]|nr:hypothetical protein [Psychrobium sp.]
MAGKPIKIMLLMLFFVLVSACSDPLDEKIIQLQKQSTTALKTLGQQLDDGQIRNALILKQYSALLVAKRSELRPLLDALAKDATSAGPMYLGLKRRVEDAKTASNFIDKQEQVEELSNIVAALNPTLFGDALSDPVNVIADMSKGELARVNSISQAQSQQANSSENFGAGSQMVGNPNYGSWSSGSGGSSFWQWYGMYAMFSNLTSPISYDRWGRNRGYSYYNDYGRHRYSSPKQRQQQQKTWNNTKKTFSKGQQYSSPYSKSRVG